MADRVHILAVDDEQDIREILRILLESRGYAVACMAQALVEGRKDHPAPGTIGRHVVEIMEKYLESAESGKLVEIHSTP